MVLTGQSVEFSNDVLEFWIYNTQDRKIVRFQPLSKGRVKMYSCGPTVYDYAHLGHARTYTMTDVLIRVLQFLGYEVFQVMNITDVGHLTTDDDWGEDKILKGLRKAKEEKGEDFTVWDLIEFYTGDFLNMLEALNIRKPDVMPRATQHVKDMISIIQTLIQKGYAYKTDKAVYFDVSRFKDYTRLFPQALDDKVVGARKEVKVDPQKRHPADFRLWQLDQPNHLLQWDTPWGKGFPGWHIECSAMSMKYLGPTFDIHTGGEDHIFPHHTNEMAQSEAATGQRFVNYWVHMYHLMVDGRKMSKSLGNFYRLQDLLDKGYIPEQVRYLFLGTHYRKRLNFTLKGLEQAASSYDKLVLHYQKIRALVVQEMLKEQASIESIPMMLDERFGFKDTEVFTFKDVIKRSEQIGCDSSFIEFLKQFVAFVSYDLRIPQALSLVWRYVKSNEPAECRLLGFSLVLHVFGLRLVPQYTPLEHLILKSIRYTKTQKSGSNLGNKVVDGQILQDIVVKLELIQELKRRQDWEKVDQVKHELQQTLSEVLREELTRYGVSVQLMDLNNITIPVYVRQEPGSPKVK